MAIYRPRGRRHIPRFSDAATNREETMLRAFLTVAMMTSIAAPAAAQISDDVVKLGVLTDMSSLYSDINGVGGICSRNPESE